MSGLSRALARAGDASVRASRWRVLPFALCVAVGTVGPAAGEDRANRQSERLAGPVHVVAGETSTVRRVGSRLVDDGERRQPLDTVTFDAAGRVATRDIIDDYGFPVGRQTYRHEGGRLMESTLRNPKVGLIERRVYSYTTGDTPSAVAITDARGRGYEEQYRRGSGGRLERITYVERGAPVGWAIFTYETGPEPAAVAFFDRTNQPATAPVGPCLGAHRVSFRYTGSRIDEQALFEPDGSRKRRSTFRYDAAGNITQEVRTESYGELRFEHLYEYDARGNWIARTTTTTRDLKGLRGQDHSTSIHVTRRAITYY